MPRFRPYAYAMSFNASPFIHPCLLPHPLKIVVALALLAISDAVFKYVFLR